MKLEHCSTCGHDFDAEQHRYSGGAKEALSLRMPSTQVAQSFTVRCPNCGVIFPSETLRMFGFVRYAHLPLIILGFILLGALVTWAV